MNISQQANAAKHELQQRLGGKLDIKAIEEQDEDGKPLPTKWGLYETSSGPTTLRMMAGPMSKRELTQWISGACWAIVSSKQSSQVAS
jgi:hypothetical protein